MEGGREEGGWEGGGRSEWQCTYERPCGASSILITIEETPLSLGQLSFD